MKKILNPILDPGPVNAPMNGQELTDAMESLFGSTRKAGQMAKLLGVSTWTVQQTKLGNQDLSQAASLALRLLVVMHRNDLIDPLKPFIGSGLEDLA